MGGLTAILEKFPEHEFTLRRLYTTDPEFKSLCEDYTLADSALSRWKEDPARAEQYRRMVHELEDEALEYIEGRHPQQIGRQ